MRMNLENASRSWGRPRVQECGDARAHDDRDEEARQKSSVFSKRFCDMSYEATVDNAGFQTKRRIVGWMKHVPNGREERKTAREGTREPVKQNSQGSGPQNP